MQKRFLVFGAHPDEPDLMFGGAALKLIKAGHAVKFVSVTNGCAGHHILSEQELIPRRYQEAQASAEILGLEEYQIMNNPDGRLENTLKNREDITRIIREFLPDVVITHRLCDYHPDHRITSQLVLDTSFLLRVPHFCPEAPVPPKNPVFAHSFDTFTDPRPVRMDAFVDISDCIEEKYRLVDCHKSQFYEWLPWVDLDEKNFSAEGWSWEEKMAFIDKHWGWRFKIQASMTNGRSEKYAEIFEYSPYGRKASQEEFQALFDL